LIFLDLIIASFSVSSSSINKGLFSSIVILNVSSKFLYVCSILLVYEKDINERRKRIVNKRSSP
jgi:hypothetical protein